MAQKSIISPDQVLPSLLRSNMLRMILTKHIELNKSADAKASMLITAASIVVAITFTASEKQTGLVFLIILVSSILAIVFAILVIIPKPYVKRGKGGRNLLHFRSFRELSEDEYVEAMQEMMMDKKDMYEQYIRDIYQYGNVTLSKKYRWLTAGLTLFLAGLAIVGLLLLFQFVRVNFW